MSEKQTVNRENLIQTLEFVQPGLSPKEIIEQSSCVVFDSGVIRTFNDEVSCSIGTDLNFTGAVQAAPLLALLHKIRDDEIEVEPTDKQLIIYGKRKSAGIAMEADVTLPVDQVERPQEWKDLHENFVEAIRMAQQCVGKDESKFAMTCVHIHPKWVEACDDCQLIRYKIKTGVSSSVLVKGHSIQQITELGMQEFSETETWIHFRNPNGLIMSCRRHLDEYEVTPPEFEGHPLTLPKGLIEASETAGICSKEHGEEDLVTVLLKNNKLKIHGEGVTSWYKEFKTIKYKGEPLEFMIAPLLLGEIVKRMNECEISKRYLRVKGPKWTYITALREKSDNGQTEE